MPHDAAMNSHGMNDHGVHHLLNGRLPAIAVPEDDGSFDEQVHIGQALSQAERAVSHQPKLEEMRFGSMQFKGSIGLNADGTIRVVSS
mgnify:CR=1 FL=1